MKQNISALMDGELFDDESDALLDRLKRHPETRHEWDTYHLISDVLRQPDHLVLGMDRTMHERLQSEPTVLAPRAKKDQRVKWYAMSAAASLMALTLVTWLSARIGSEPAPQLAMKQPAVSVRPVNFSDARMSNYLMAHQEFSPSADVQGAATYISSVSGQ